MRNRNVALLLALGIFGPGVTRGQTPARLTGPIDDHALVTLRGNVRTDLTADRDLGAVEDGLPFRLYLVLQRGPAQQADLDNFLARQQQPTAPEYHKWLTPQEFGARFGAAPQDIAKLSAWLESHGFQVHGVMNNAGMIDFSGTAGQVREAFHTELHYFNIQGGRYAANVQDPQIPAALAPVVAGIQGLSKIPVRSKRTPGHPVAYDAQKHRWLDVEPPAGVRPRYDAGFGSFNVTPQDFYTIYNLNPIFQTGNLGAGATIGLPEPTDMQFGTVNPSTGAATGGDVATFRSLFGVAGTLNMTVLHGAGTVTCSDPGITSAVGEAALDAEWANAVAPSAHLIFMACGSTSVGDGFTTALTALIDNNLSDVISSSYGNSEAVLSASDFATDDLLASQAAAQGQSFLDAAGDAGSADEDQNTTTTATHGFNVDQYAGQPLVTAVGGTDFSDAYDAAQGGLPLTTYWSLTNSAFFGDALGYIPETPWNGSCADSIIANNAGFTGAGYCASLTPTGIDGNVVGGGGGFSAHYAQPSYQPGTPGLSAAATNRATPDIAFFAASGFWGHSLIQCDSTVATTACTSPTTFEAAGGTSFTAPQFAGVTALLVTLTGERQGTLNPALYALAKAQYAAGATATACYSNGQTNNIGVTTGLPAAGCIFNDVTTGNNDEGCKAGSLDCYVNAGAQFGMLSTTGASSLTVAYPAGVGYDEATGLGSVNIANLINHWNAAYTSTTGITASATSILATQSTLLTATVTGGTPAGSTGPAPALAGSVNFTAGSAPLGSCTLSSGSCSLSVLGSALQPGANSVTATFVGSGTYPASTSSIVTVILASSAGPLSCAATSAGIPLLRPEGYTELTGDILITCTGGPVLQQGAAIPTANIVVYLAPSVPVTSRFIGSNGASDALLLIDEPGAGISTGVGGPYGPNAPQTLCTTANQQATGGSLCPAFVGRDLTGSYEVAVTAAGGITAAQNVYQGKIGDFGSNSVAFYNVPVLPPASAGVTRIFRITNIRVPVPGGNLTGALQALISTSPNQTLPVPATVVNIGVVGPLTAATVSESGKNPFLNAVSPGGAILTARIAFTEGFATSFKTRVVPGGAANGSGNVLYAAEGTNTASPFNQNIPGALYGGFGQNSESGLIFPALVTANTGPGAINYTAGLADYGTRLKAVFYNIPAGITLYVSAVSAGAAPAVIGGTSVLPYAVLVAGNAGEAIPDGASFLPIAGTTTGSDGLAAVPLTVNGAGAAVAVWEVTNANPAAIDTLTFSVYINYTSSAPTVTYPYGLPAPTGVPPGVAINDVQLSLAPEPSGGTFSTANATQGQIPTPRFAVIRTNEGPWVTIVPFTCAVTGDAAPGIADVQLIINEALGVAPAVNDLNFDGVVNVADVQKVIDAVLMLGCPY